MTRFLLITLAAPLASFGELAGHERRGTLAHPTRSALLGLLGAALGVRRDDDNAQKALALGYETALRVDRPGEAMQDFHTIQTVQRSPKLHPRTRADALRRGKVNTTITRRDYRMDVLFTAAIVARENARWPLETLKDALEKPRFTLWLGRKSCPLSLPLAPRIVEATSMLDALRQSGASLTEKQEEMLRRAASRPGDNPYAAIDAALPIAGTNTPHRLERINDQPLDRRRWHFTSRREAIIPLAEDPHEGDDRTSEGDAP